MTLIGER